MPPVQISFSRCPPLLLYPTDFLVTVLLYRQQRLEIQSLVYPGMTGTSSNLALSVHFSLSLVILYHFARKVDAETSCSGARHNYILYSHFSSWILTLNLPNYIHNPQCKFSARMFYRENEAVPIFSLYDSLKLRTHSYGNKPYYYYYYYYSDYLQDWW